MTSLCHISKSVKGECDTCGKTVDHLHMPEELHGWYCEACCPVCSEERLRLQRQKDRQVKVAA